MGQSQTGQSNPMLEDWHQHQHRPNIFVNAKTNEEAESHLIILKKNQEPYLRKRMQEHHNFVVKILYYEPIQKHKLMKDEAKFVVYTERLFPLSQNMWIPVTSALSILKGFRRLSSSFGMLRVNSNMIKVNAKKDIQVWITQNSVKSEPIYKAESEEQMLADIVKIIMQFDNQTGSLMVKCYTLNQAINNILHNITENKTVLHFSSRTNKKDDKSKMYTKQVTLANKNPFRSTKETEDDSLKPFNDSGVKYTGGKKEVSLQIQTQEPSRYLHNVNVQKSPTYINPDQILDSPKKFQSPAFRKISNQGSISTNYNFTQPNNVAQKQSSIQFNNSQPGKAAPIVRPYKPIEHKNQNFTQSVYSYNSMQNQMSPSHEKSVNKDSAKFKQGLYKPTNLVNYQPQRKSNINKNYLERVDKMDLSQDSDLQNESKGGKGSLHVNTNQRSQINTSRQFMGVEPQPYITRHPIMNDGSGTIFTDSNRTKTQQFYSSSNDFGYSPRIRTNYIHSNSQMHKLGVAQSGINVVKKTYPQMNIPTSPNAQRKYQQSTEVLRYKSQFQDSKEKNQSNSETQEDEKKQMKLKQAQKIKEEMGCLGIIGITDASITLSKPLLNDKSARDLLIKQKVQQKNKKHEELKSAITRLLND